MKTSISFPMLFWTAFFLTIVGALLKLMHVGFAYPFLLVGVLATLAYMVFGIYEVNTSSKIRRSEKFMWTIGFIFIGFITGLVYIFSGRRRIV